MIFGWLKRKPRQLWPEAKWIVDVQDKAISVTDDAGVRKSVGLDSLSGIAIETNDSGPWGADFWWLFFDEKDQLACAFPEGATGQKEAVDRLLKLPGFRHEEFTKAIRSTGNAVFAVWRKNGGVTRTPR